MSTWQLHGAKSKFSDVVKRADCTRLTQPKPRFAEFMQRSPMVGVELDTSRQADVVREITL